MTHSTDVTRRIKLRFDDVPALRAHLDQLARQPHTAIGAWTAGQIYYHLAAAIELSCDGASESRAPFARLLKLPMRLVALRIGLPKGAAIPDSVSEKVTPPADADDAAELARLSRAIDVFESSDTVAPVHPILGPLRKADWRRFHLRHCELHLGCLVETREAS